jgi:hypothetical protein
MKGHKEKMKIKTILIKSFCWGVQGGSFFKKRPPGRRRLKKKSLPSGNLVLDFLFFPFCIFQTCIFS